MVNFLESRVHNYRVSTVSGRRTGRNPVKKTRSDWKGKVLLFVRVCNDVSEFV